MFYFKTKFKVEMADQIETFDLSAHMHDAFNFSDPHLEFGKFLEDSRP